MNITAHKCGFNDCETQIIGDDAACRECCYKLHMMIRAMQGIPEEEARIEWERSEGPSLN